MAEVLVVVTNTKRIADVRTESDRLWIPAGAHFEETAKPIEVLARAGHTAIVASCKGGPVPPYKYNPENDEHRDLMERLNLRAAFENTRMVTSVDPDAIDALFFVGGAGTMWDFPRNPILAELIITADKAGKPIGAICHGPSVFDGVRVDGRPYVHGKKVIALTDEEEARNQMNEVVPFSLEQMLRAQGAIFEPKGAAWEDQVEINETQGRFLATAKNPASATHIGEVLVELLAQR